MNCLWCDKPFTPRQGGKTQRFCSTDHRRAFEAALREWARCELEAGRMTVADLRADTCPSSNASVSSEPILAVAGGQSTRWTLIESQRLP